MKKAINALSMICAVMLLFSSCAAPNSHGYKYYESDGQYYIAMDVEPDGSIPSGAQSLSYANIRFQSLEEARSDILNGNFTEDEWWKLEMNLKYWFASNTLPTTDIEKIPQAVYPEGFSKEYYRWNGEIITLFLEYDFYVSVYFSQSDPLRRDLDGWIADLDVNQTIESYLKAETADEEKYGSRPYRLEVEHEEDLNATVLRVYRKLHFEDGQVIPEELKRIHRSYSFTNGDTTYYVEERKLELTEAIYCLVVKNNEYVVFVFSPIDIDEGLPADLFRNPDFLSQFSFAPYEG